MALRNAFEEMATETTLNMVLKAVTLARDTAQRLRVVVDGGSISVVSGPLLHSSGSAGTYRTWYDPYGALTSMEQREIQRVNSLQAGMQARAKWTYV